MKMTTGRLKRIIEEELNHIKEMGYDYKRDEDLEEDLEEAAQPVEESKPNLLEDLQSLIEKHSGQVQLEETDLEEQASPIEEKAEAIEEHKTLNKSVLEKMIMQELKSMQKQKRRK